MITTRKKVISNCDIGHKKKNCSKWNMQNKLRMRLRKQSKFSLVQTQNSYCTSLLRKELQLSDCYLANANITTDITKNVNLSKILNKNQE